MVAILIPIALMYLAPQGEAAETNLRGGVDQTGHRAGAYGDAG